MMTETPKYTVLEQDGLIELRQYPAYIKAEVEVSNGSMRQAVYQGFNVLAGYIFGSNVKSEKISMTTPVVAAPSKETAFADISTFTEQATVTEVERKNGQGGYTVAFIMPAEYKLDTLPKPKDETIRFVSLPPHRAAVIRTSGYFADGKFDSAKGKLSAWLLKENLETEGSFTAAGYNQPWVPGFMRRNEVMIRIKAEETQSQGEPSDQRLSADQ